MSTMYKQFTCLHSNLFRALLVVSVLCLYLQETNATPSGDPVETSKEPEPAKDSNADTIQVHLYEAYDNYEKVLVGKYRLPSNQSKKAAIVNSELTITPEERKASNQDYYKPVPQMLLRIEIDKCCTFAKVDTKHDTANVNNGQLSLKVSGGLDPSSQTGTFLDISSKGSTLWYVAIAIVNNRTSGISFNLTGTKVEHPTISNIIKNLKPETQDYMLSIITVENGIRQGDPVQVTFNSYIPDSQLFTVVLQK